MREQSGIRRWVWLAMAAIGAAPVVAGEWALPDSRIGVRTAPLLLMTRPDVQADLGLNSKQIESLHRAVVEIGGRAARIPGGSGAEAIAARRAVDEAQEAWIGKHLTEEQQGRLLQVDLQWEGPGALVSREWVARRLKLNEEQARAIGAAVVRNRSDHDARALLSTLEATLTVEQRSGWQTLVGRVFVSRPVDQTMPVRPSEAAVEP